MKASYSNLMQSKYFSPAFNSAIFDGPLRIYFAQFHESMALKIYFMAQQKLMAELARAKEVSKAAQANILVMIYPTEDSFEETFLQRPKVENICVESWNDDVVIGLRGPLEDAELDGLIHTLSEVMRSWAPKNQPVPTSAEL
jgi:hypothetical protein